MPPWSRAAKHQHPVRRTIATTRPLSQPNRGGEKDLTPTRRCRTRDCPLGEIGDSSKPIFWENQNPLSGDHGCCCGEPEFGRGFLSPQAEASRERDRSTSTGSLYASIRRPQRPYCGLLDSLDSRSLFFIATDRVWFAWRCRGGANRFQIASDFSVQKPGFLDGFLAEG